MAPRRPLCSGDQGNSGHACPAASRPPSCWRKARRAGSSGGRVVTLAVGLLCSSTAPTPAFGFFLPGAAVSPSGRSAGGNSMGVGGGRAVGVSSLRSSFAGSPCVATLPGGRSRLARQSREGAGAGGLRMGIPKLFRWLTDQYPAISQRLDQGLNEVISIFEHFRCCGEHAY